MYNLLRKSIAFYLSLLAIQVSNASTEPTGLEDFVPKYDETNIHPKKILECPLGLNHDGSILAFYNHESNTINFHPLNGQKLELKPIHINSSEKFVVDEITWTYNPDYLLLTLMYPFNTKKLNTYRESQLVILDIQSGKQRLMSEKDVHTEIEHLSPLFPHEILISRSFSPAEHESKSEEKDKKEKEDTLKTDANSKAIETYRRATHTVLARYNLITGAITEITSADPTKVTNFIVDDNYKVFGAWHELSTNTETRVSIYRPSKYKLGEWDEVFAANGDKGDLSVECASRDNKWIYLVDGRNHNHRKLYKVSLKNGRHVYVDKVKGRSITGIIPNFLDKEGQGPDYFGIMTRFINNDIIHADERIKPLINAFKSKDGNLLIGMTAMKYFKGSMSLDRKKVVIQVAPNSFRVIDIEPFSQGKEFGLVPRLEALNKSIAPMFGYSVQTLDGFVLTYYLTTPVNAEGPLPCVVDIHGGPWARNKVAYDYRAQSLAQLLEVATLQVNFRGSNGFGKKFRFAGDGEWSGKILEDILFVVNKLIKEEKIDPKRLLVAGASFGGFATNAMMTFHPDVFQAGYCLNGDCELNEMLKQADPESRIYWSRRVAAEKGETFLTKNSPAHFADKVKGPMVLVCGDQDFIVKPEQTTLMAQSLREKEKNVREFRFKGEGHDFEKRENVLIELALYHQFVAGVLKLQPKYEIDGLIKNASDLEERTGDKAEN